MKFQVNMGKKILSSAQQRKQILLVWKLESGFSPSLHLPEKRKGGFSLTLGPFLLGRHQPRAKSEDWRCPLPGAPERRHSQHRPELQESDGPNSQLGNRRPGRQEALTGETAGRMSKALVHTRQLYLPRMGSGGGGRGRGRHSAGHGRLLGAHSAGV